MSEGRKGLLQEMKNGFPLTISEEEFEARRGEISLLAEKWEVNLAALDLLEKDYRLKLLVLSMASYFGFREISGEELLQAAHLEAPGKLNPMKYFFMQAGWMPYYLEYTFNDQVGAAFHEVIDTIYVDVEFYMDMSDQLRTVRLPNALRKMGW